MNETIVNAIKNDIYEYIHTSLPARIIDFNHVDMTATIQILAKLKIRGIEQVPIALYKVPVGYSKCKNFAERIPLKRDDIVYISFSEVSLEKILTTGMSESVLGNSKFDLSDAVITTCISLQNSKLTDENKDDWCLFNLKTGHKIIFKETGEIEIISKKTLINSDEEIELKSKTIKINASSKIEITTPLINALNSHLNIKSIEAINVITDTFEALKSAVIKGIDFITHKHGGVKVGADKTGGAE